jgi:hypothetical protein
MGGLRRAETTWYVLMKSDYQALTNQKVSAFFICQQFASGFWRFQLCFFLPKNISKKFKKSLNVIVGSVKCGKVKGGIVPGSFPLFTGG